MEPVPFSYLQNYVGAFHKWIGKNEVHDEVSLYSFSWLRGGYKKGNALHFPNGADWFISFADDNLAKQCIKGILDDPRIAFGMQVVDVMLQDNPHFTSQEVFQVASPVLLKQSDDKVQNKFYFYNDEKSTEVMTHILKRKLAKAGLSGEGVEVSFDKDYPHPKLKLMTYKNIHNKGSICPVIVKGTPEQVVFAWNVGVGNSTGIGFGSLV